MIRNLIFWSGITGVLLFVLIAILGGFQLPAYSHISQLLSETYALGTPNGKAIRYFGYIPIGILITTFAFLAKRIWQNSSIAKTGFTGLGIFYGLGTVVVGLFPCDPGCNKDFVDPSISHLIHSFSGLLTYIFVPISIILIGAGLLKIKNSKNLGLAAIACGISCFIFSGLFLSYQESNYIGVFQRLAEGSVLIWIVLCAIFVKWKTNLNDDHNNSNSLE